MAMVINFLLEKMDNTIYCTKEASSFPVANLTIASYSDNIVKIYSMTHSLVNFNTYVKYFIKFEKYSFRL
jgi:hypothetical protein